jgi:hypothetical protein
MRARLVTTLALLLVGCNSRGTQVQQSSDAGGDATIGDAGGDAEDANEEQADAGAPCTPIVPGNPVPSMDCVFAGSCPIDCLQGTAGAYVCNADTVAPDSGAYPSEFQAPTGIVTVVGFDTAAYPWDAGAWVSCGPLACVRWATADHVDGGSAWPADPCDNDAGEPLAWVCPPSSGVLPPPDAGCTNAGDMNIIGGGEAGVPANTVWCCPGVSPSTSDGGSTEGGATEGGSGEDGGDSGGD